MTELDRLNASLKSEADIILYRHDLLGVLARYGTPVVLGSYVFDTMTWADLDLYLICDAPDAGDFFELAKEIENCLKTDWMKYLNNMAGKWPDLPRGLYWGVQTSHGVPRLWNIDIWRLGPTVAQEHLEFQAALQDRITPECRQAILQIKSHFCIHPKYGRGFAGFDVYKAVLNDGVQSVAEFERVLREKGIIE